MFTRLLQILYYRVFRPNEAATCVRPSGIEKRRNEACGAEPRAVSKNSKGLVKMHTQNGMYRMVFAPKNSTMDILFKFYLLAKYTDRC